MTFGDMDEGRTMRERLREKFPPEQIGKLPRVTCTDCSNRAKTCSKHTKSKCKTCNAYVSSAHIHLDYVGHAAVVDRLNRYAPDWTFTLDKLFDHADSAYVLGTMTIGGVSRQEYGDGKDPKEAVSNFVRRGAMRFGVALDLWSKEELESASPAASPAAPQGDSAGHEPETVASPGAVAAGESSGDEPEPQGEGGDGSSSDSTATHDHIEHRPRDCGPWSEKTPDGKLLVKGYVACQVCGHVVPKTEARVA